MFPKYSEIQIPLLLEISRRGGSCKPRDQDSGGSSVYASLALHFELTAEESGRMIESGSSPENKWENMVRWARNDLRKRGELDGSRRGWWTITEDGQKRISEEASETHWVGLSGKPVTPAELEQKLLEQAKVGLAGEEWVVEYERERLKNAGRADLARQVRHVALEDVGAGFDVESFDVDGARVAIEVKSTRGRRDAGFEITANEWKVARRLGSRYWLYRVKGIGTSKIKVLTFKNLEQYVLNQKLQMQATAYRVVRGEQY